MDLKKLAAPFPNVKFRIGAKTTDGKKGMALAYIDARDVMNRLDEVVGIENWSDSYETYEKGIVICRISIKVSDKGESYGDKWNSKSDAAPAEKYAEIKNSFSDAFKRAAVKWGIGRYLYSLPAQWVPLNETGYKFATEPTIPDEWKVK